MSKTFVLTRPDTHPIELSGINLEEDRPASIEDWSEAYQVFETYEEAKAEIADHIQALTDAVENGDMEDFDEDEAQLQIRQIIIQKNGDVSLSNPLESEDDKPEEWFDYTAQEICENTGGNWDWDEESPNV